ncbi:hypothetical protein HETIRDRAFT_171676 [Heterobasidion irregulare TC 32-1]|uniref:BAG domain-containing protein n=1 Tax=Heterobasidion irregulare (strain TC 32-1) TaxID=747525 RepID=W4K1X9_HETIT|nr:uncharacterized protein HETIRDRAFT_171676 [Heterobasidion irregulare TC 32-1]ETW79797.1 hypothetical protein HETIRDRAFT_171676 [Heterobasidion irregulare TC 32-1]
MLFYAPSAPHLLYPAPSPPPFSNPFHAYGPPAPRTCRQDHAAVLSSRERYVRAQAEMRAAEAQYAASLSHAREEATLREQRQRQRALHDELLIARALQIQAERAARQQAADAERRRAELIGRRLLWDATVSGGLGSEDLPWVEPPRRARYPFAAPRAREAVRPDLEEPPLVGLDDILRILRAADQRQRAPTADRRPPTETTQPPTASDPLPTPQPKQDAKGKGKARDTSPGPDPDPSLRSRLEERLGHGSADEEMEETVRSLIASLFGEDPRSARAAGEPSSSKVCEARPSSLYPIGLLTSPLCSQVKLPPDARATKGAPALVSSPASRAPTPTSGLDAVTAIESSFRALQHAFTFPSTLDFDAPPAPPTTSPATPAPTSASHDYPLAYTPTNAPVRAYEHALSALLAQLDAVESDGDAAVRARRRGVVRDIERALDEVDRIVGERRAERAERAGSAQVPVDVGERAVAAAAGERARVDLEVPEAVSADAALAVQHAPPPNLPHASGEPFVAAAPTPARAPTPESPPATPESAVPPDVLVLVPAPVAVAVDPPSATTSGAEAAPQDEELPALAPSLETVQATSTDSAPLTPDADVGHATAASSVSRPPSPLSPSPSPSPSPSEAEIESQPDTTEPPAPAPSARASPPPAPSDAPEEYLSSLSHAQFTFPPRRELSAEEPEDAVLVESDVDNTSERDAWSEVEA